jgi:hypothetical protein
MHRPEACERGGGEMEAGSLVKLSGRLPRVRTLHLSNAEAVQALSLDPPPSGERQFVCVHGTSALLTHPALHHDVSALPSSLPSCLQLMQSVSRGPGRLS